MRAWVGLGQALHYVFVFCILHLHFPSKKSPLQKSWALYFCEPHPPRARSARHAAESVVFFGRRQRKPLRIESCLQHGDSIQPSSNPFYQQFELTSHAPRAWSLLPKSYAPRALTSASAALEYSRGQPKNFLAFSARLLPPPLRRKAKKEERKFLVCVAILYDVINDYRRTPRETGTHCRRIPIL